MSSTADPLLGSSSRPGNKYRSISPFLNVSEDARHSDVFFTWFYLGCVVLCVLGGCVGVLNRDARFFTADPTDPAECPMLGDQIAPRRLGASESVADIALTVAAWLSASALGALLLAVLFVRLFQLNARVMVWAAAALQVALPACAAVACLVLSISPGVPKEAHSSYAWGALGALAATALQALVFYLWRRELDQCADLLELSSKALQANPGLLGAVVGLKLGLGVGVGLLAVGVAAAAMNGSLQPNPYRGGVPAVAGSCRDQATGQQIPCCAWQPAAWVAPFQYFAGVVLLWSVFVALQVRTFVTASVTAEWYFGRGGVDPSASSPPGAVGWSVRRAFTTSFGSLTFGAAVLTLARLLRDAAQRLRDQQAQEGASIVLCLLQCITDLIAEALEFITKFATVMVAITGESFLSSGRAAYTLLTRNFLSTIGVWWIPRMVLSVSAILLALCWGAASLGVSHLVLQGGGRDGLRWGLAAGAAAVVWLVLEFVSTVLLDVVDAIYVCWALDKDAAVVTVQEVHDVFEALPAGVVVKQPGGGAGYGTVPGRPGPSPSAPPMSQV